MYRETAEQLLAFLEKSPSCFHAIKNMKEILSADGFAELKEEDKWEITKGGRYFVTRNDSSIVAFTIPETGFMGYPDHGQPAATCLLSRSRKMRRWK